MDKKYTERWASANELHEQFGTVRAWLREQWKNGKIRRRAISSRGHDGEIKIKYLYNCADVERELGKSEGNQECRGGAY